MTSALHTAFQEALDDARSRAEKGMSKTAAGKRAQAANIKRLRDDILATLSEKERAAFLDYQPPGN